MNITSYLITKNLWTLQIVTVPAGAKYYSGVYLSYVQLYASILGDNWAVTSLLTSGESNSISISAVTTDSTFYPVFVAGTGNQVPSIRTSPTAFSFNPSTGRMEINGAFDCAGDITVETSPFINMIPTISSDYTVTTAYNSLSVGPVTINSGVTVTVESGATWTIV